MNYESGLILQRQKNFLIKISYWSVILILTCFILKITLPVCMPFIFAFIIACILNYPIEGTLKRINLKRSTVSILFVILFYSISTFLLILIGGNLITFVKELFSNLPHIFTSVIIPFVETLFNDIDKLMISIDSNIISNLEEISIYILNLLEGSISRISTNVIELISGTIKLIPGTLIKVLITIIATFFITIDFRKIVAFIKRQIPKKTKIILWESKNYISETVLKCILSYFIIMAITFVEIFIGFSILGIPKAGIISIIIALFDILPILGSGGILIPWAIISLICGNYKIGIGMVILYITITVIRNIIEPKLVGNQIGLHPIITLASMLLGGKLFGFIGLLGLPIFLSFIKNLNDRKIINIIK